MGVVASQITSLMSVYSTVYSGTNQRKHQSSASLAFVRGIHPWPVNSPHKYTGTPKMLPFDDVIMNSHPVDMSVQICPKYTAFILSPHVTHMQRVCTWFTLFIAVWLFLQYYFNTIQLLSNLWYEGHTESQNLNLSCLDNEDVVGAAPTGDAPTLSAWSTISLLTTMRLILEVWRYID